MFVLKIPTFIVSMFSFFILLSCDLSIQPKHNFPFQSEATLMTGIRFFALTSCRKHDEKHESCTDHSKSIVRKKFTFRCI